MQKIPLEIPTSQTYIPRNAWEEVPILTKTLDLYKLYYEYSKLFPKKDKYTVGAICERYIIRTIELLTETSYLPKEQKQKSLSDASSTVEVLKVFVRLLKDMRIIDQKKYLILQTAIQEIGRMLGGWLKTVR